VVVVVVVIAVRNQHCHRAHQSNGAEQVHGALVGDESVDAAAELSACSNQHCQHSAVSHSSNARNDQTRPRRRLNTLIPPGEYD